MTDDLPSEIVHMKNYDTEDLVKVIIFGVLATLAVISLAWCSADCSRRGGTLVEGYWGTPTCVQSR